MIALSVKTLQSLYLHSPRRKGGDVVAVQIEEHQLFRARQSLGVDGSDGISFQIDALNFRG